MKGTIASIGVVAALSAVSGGSSIDKMTEIKLKGYLGEKLDIMIERHVKGTDVDYITAPFLEKTETKGWWQTEFWGKFMHSAVPYQVYTGCPKLKENLDRGIARMISSQEPSGYIGNYPDALRCGEGWDVWGMKYTMMGFLHYYDLTKDAKALETCKKVCDYVIAEIGPNGRRGRELWQTGNWSGYASSSILEPVMWLYNRSKEQKYLDFAAFLVKGMTEPEAGPRLLDLALKGISVADRNGYGNVPEKHGGYVMKHNRWKSYEMMSCYQGLIEYYEVTGRKELLDAAVATGKDIIKEEINLAGGCACSEAWFHGARKQHLPYVRLQETCVTTTWMRFCEKLLEITGDPLWADQLERTFYNAYLGAMKADGSEFAGYTPLSGNRYHGQHHCYMHTDCCTANGPRGFLCFIRNLFTADDSGMTFNFYASALAKGKVKGKDVAFDMYAIYPRENWARIVSHTDGAGIVPLKLRIPSWSASAEVKVNGEKAGEAKGGTYFAVEREWKYGDIVEIAFDMPVVAHVVDSHVAFTRGPVLLARDSRLGPGEDLSTAFRMNSVHDGQRMDFFLPTRTQSDDIWIEMSATVPIGVHHRNPEGRNWETVFFCDYASAGNLWRRDNFYRTWFPIERGPRD